MPSDFHPLLLVLGNTDDLLQFSKILREFSETGGALQLTDVGVHSTDTTVIIQEIESDSSDILPGLMPTDTVGALAWQIPKSYAAIFADDVIDLVQSGEASGSATLECQRPNEIKVKVSIGEWEDHYLTDDLR